MNAPFAVLFNSAMGGVRCLCCTGVEKATKASPVQVSEVSVILLVTARGKHHSVHLLDKTDAVPKMTPQESLFFPDLS